MAFQLSRLLSICCPHTPTKKKRNIKKKKKKKPGGGAGGGIQWAMGAWCAYLGREVRRGGEDGCEVPPHGRDEVRREAHLRRRARERTASMRGQWEGIRSTEIGTCRRTHLVFTHRFVVRGEDARDGVPHRLLLVHLRVAFL